MDRQESEGRTQRPVPAISGMPGAKIAAASETAKAKQRRGSAFMRKMPSPASSDDRQRGER